MRPLQKKDLRPSSELTRSFFRSSCAELDRRRFRERWKTSSASPLALLRAFPSAWYVDLADLSSKRVPGREVFGYGNADPDRFAVLLLDAIPTFAFDELTDAGPVPAALDALRYFVLVSHGYAKRDELQQLISLYVDITLDRDHARSLPLHLLPDLDSVAREELLAWTDGTVFRADTEDLQPLPCWRDDRLLECIRLEESASDLRIETVVQRGAKPSRERDRRYLVLARSLDGRPELLELDEQRFPASSWARSLRVPDDRLVRAASLAWGRRRPRHFRVVRVGRSDFVLRSRLDRVALRPQNLPPEQCRALLQAQVSILAKAHRGAYSPEEDADVIEWLAAGTRLIGRRYAATFDRLHG